MKYLMLILLLGLAFFNYSCEDSLGIDDHVLRIEDNPGDIDIPDPIIVENISISCVELYDNGFGTLPITWNIYQRITKQNILIDTSESIWKLEIKNLDVKSEMGLTGYESFGLDQDLRVINFSCSNTPVEIDNNVTYDITGVDGSDSYITLQMEDMSDDSKMSISSDESDTAMIVIDEHDPDNRSIAGSIGMVVKMNGKFFKAFTIGFLLYY